MDFVCCCSYFNGFFLSSFGWCISFFCSRVIIDGRLIYSLRRVLSGGFLGLGISVFKILGFDRVNICFWVDGFEYFVNIVSDYCK